MSSAIPRKTVAILALAAALVATAFAAFAHRGGSETVPYRITVPPGADPSGIPMDITGVRLVEIDQAGGLLVHRGSRIDRFAAPSAYQDINGVRHVVAARFDINASGHVRFAVGTYDATRPLVIHSPLP
jgi:hypothetical protein